MRLKFELFVALTLAFTFTITLASISASAAIPPIATTPVAGETGVMAQPTEGGIVFYNRKLIAATLGKAHQLFLTFDDGPNPNTTPLVLDILKRWNLKGIFFLVGMNVRKYPNLVKRIYDEGHTIGNHSYYHINLRLFKADRVLREIRETNELITQITGVRPRVFRPPYGALNSTVVNILRQEGMDIMLWTFDPRDWRNRNMNKTMASLKQQLHLEVGGKGGIILLHDTLPSSVAALEPLLTTLAQCNLLPTPYPRNQSHGRAFWAAKPPSVLHDFVGSRQFPPEVTGRGLLVAILNPPVRAEFTAVGLLRAKKTGALFSTLFCRSF